MLSLIAAISQNRVIGNENKLLWHIPEDMQRFKRLTTGHPVIMGRKTFESIGHPLPKRLNIIITHDHNYQAPGCIIVHSLEDAIEKADRLGHSEQSEESPTASVTRMGSLDKLGMTYSNEIFIIGGAQIYAQAIDLVDKLYLTVVHKNFKGDAVFPDYSRFDHVVFQKEETNQGLKYTFLELIPLKQKLTPEQYNICFLKGTEPPFSGKYYNNHAKGMYVCIACGQELFPSSTKFDSGTGWPSFWDPVAKANVKTEVDHSLGLTRTEIMCSKCGAHLGHVFNDGPKDKSGLRYCINSLALNFKPTK